MNKAFDEVFDDVTRFGTKVKTDEYRDSGTHIIIDQGQGQIAGYTNLEKGLFTDVPAIVFGDHTRIIKYVEKPFFLGADGVKVFRSKDDNANYKYLYYALKHVDIPNTGYNRHFKWLKESHIPYPSYTKQKQIVEVLDLVVDIMEKRRKELSALDDLAKSRFMEMFAGRDANATISDFVDRNIVAAGQKYQPDDEISYIDISSVNGTFHGIEGVQSYLFKDAPSRAQQCVIEGDILFSLVRPNLKKMAIVTANHDQSVASTGFCVIRPKDRSTGFLQCLLQSDQFTDTMVDVAKGTSYPAVTNKQVLGYYVPEPSSDEKSQLTELVQQTDKSKLAIRKSLDELQLLYDSLMQEYFG